MGSSVRGPRPASQASHLEWPDCQGHGFCTLWPFCLKGTTKSLPFRRKAGLIPWQAWKSLTWDVTVVCSLADSYVTAVTREAGSVAELTAARKSAKYTESDYSCTFQPIVIESLGTTNNSVRDFLFSCWTLVARFPFSHAMTDRLAFCISDSLSLFWFSGFMQFLLHADFVQKED